MTHSQKSKTDKSEKIDKTDDFQNENTKQKK